MSIPPIHPAAGMHARRFVKFCIVGASSTAILMLIEELVVRLLAGGQHRPPGWIVQLGSALGFAAAVCNGFYWNRRWTFRVTGSGAGGQFARFLAFNVIGLALNNGFLHLFYDRLHLFTGWPKSYLFCQLLATVCVSAWNYFAHSRWTFAGHA